MTFLSDEEFDEALENVYVRVWFCPARNEHSYAPGRPHVEWVDGVAHCLSPECERSSDEHELEARETL